MCPIALHQPPNRTPTSIWIHLSAPLCLSQRISPTIAILWLRAKFLIHIWLHLHPSGWDHYAIISSILRLEWSLACNTKASWRWELGVELYSSPPHVLISHLYYWNLSRSYYSKYASSWSQTNKTNQHVKRSNKFVMIQILNKKCSNKLPILKNNTLASIYQITLKNHQIILIYLWC